MKKEKYIIKNKGITLIALIITIIVLLILAGVSLSFVMQGGILDKSQLAVNEYQNAANDESNTLNDIDKQLDKQLSIYENDGVDMDKVKEDFEANPEKYKHSDQSSTNGDRAVGTDGNPVNMDLWDGWIKDGDGVNLNFERGSGQESYPFYKNSNLEGGKIKGTVPQYIYSEADGKVYPVVSMEGTFQNTDIVTPPKIPSTVTRMSGTFQWCESLETAPELPSKVEDLTNTFAGCSALKTAPTTIPDTVINMSETFNGCRLLETVPELPNKVEDISYVFAGCIVLKTAPPIPSKVQDISYAFAGCSALTGDLIINAEKLTNYEECLADVATNPGCELKLSGSCPQLNEILKTATSGNISLK